MEDKLHVLQAAISEFQHGSCIESGDKIKEIENQEGLDIFTYYQQIILSEQNSFIKKFAIIRFIHLLKYYCKKKIVLWDQLRFILCHNLENSYHDIASKISHSIKEFLPLDTDQATKIMISVFCEREIRPCNNILIFYLCLVFFETARKFPDVLSIIQGIYQDGIMSNDDRIALSSLKILRKMLNTDVVSTNHIALFLTFFANFSSNDIHLNSHVFSTVKIILNRRDEWRDKFISVLNEIVSGSVQVNERYDNTHKIYYAVQLYFELFLPISNKVVENLLLCMEHQYNACSQIDYFICDFITNLVFSNREIVEPLLLILKGSVESYFSSAVQLIIPIYENLSSTELMYEVDFFRNVVEYVFSLAEIPIREFTFVAALISIFATVQELEDFMYQCILRLLGFLERQDYSMHAVNVICHVIHEYRIYTEELRNCLIEKLNNSSESMCTYLLDIFSCLSLSCNDFEQYQAIIGISNMLFENEFMYVKSLSFLTFCDYTIKFIDTQNEGIFLSAFKFRLERLLQIVRENEISDDPLRLDCIEKILRGSKMVLERYPKVVSDETVSFLFSLAKLESYFIKYMKFFMEVYKREEAIANIYDQIINHKSCFDDTSFVYTVRYFYKHFNESQKQNVFRIFFDYFSDQKHNVTEDLLNLYYSLFSNFMKYSYGIDVILKSLIDFVDITIGTIRRDYFYRDFFVNFTKLMARIAVNSELSQHYLGILSFIVDLECVPNQDGYYSILFIYFMNIIENPILDSVSKNNLIGWFFTNTPKFIDNLDDSKQDFVFLLNCLPNTFHNDILLYMDKIKSWIVKKETTELNSNIYSLLLKLYALNVIEFNENECSEFFWDFPPYDHTETVNMLNSILVILPRIQNERTKQLLRSGLSNIISYDHFEAKIRKISDELRQNVLDSLDKFF